MFGDINIGLPVEDPNNERFIKDAARVVIQYQNASISTIQRYLTVGYNRALNIVNHLEEKGFITPKNNEGKRDILITPEQFREYFGEDYKEI